MLPTCVFQMKIFSFMGSSKLTMIIIQLIGFYDLFTTFKFSSNRNFVLFVLGTYLTAQRRLHVHKKGILLLNFLKFVTRHFLESQI